VEDAVLNLVGLLYDAVAEPARWDTFLCTLADALGAESSSLLLYDPVSRAGNLDISAGLDPSARRRYREYYVGIDQFGIQGRHLCHPGAVLLGHELCPERLMKRSEFYTDFLKPIRAHHQICGIIARHGATLSALTSLRPESAGAFDERDRALLTTLMPHLQRALAIRVKLVGLEDLATASRSVLDRCGCALVLLATDGRIITINGHAERLLAEDDGIALGKVGLLAQRPSESAHLHKLVSRAVATRFGSGMEPAGVMSISRPSGRRAYQLLITPLRIEERWPGVEQPVVAVIITDPDREPREAGSVIASLFGLTRAETRLALTLMRGIGLKEASETLRVSHSTVRAQLKKLFEKTQTRRQSELVRVLLLSPASLHGAQERKLPR
jgi:DNA-binding CsgD family transcriptional regulator